MQEGHHRLDLGEGAGNGEFRGGLVGQGLQDSAAAHAASGHCHVSTMPEQAADAHDVVHAVWGPACLSLGQPAIIACTCQGSALLRSRHDMLLLQLAMWLPQQACSSPSEGAGAEPPVLRGDLSQLILRPSPLRCWHGVGMTC